jgi:hypothetical protein
VHNQTPAFPRKVLYFSFLLGISALSLAVAAPPKAAKPAAEKPADKHAHEDHGPHDGELIELGEDEYHGEIVIDEEKDLVTIYVLDDKAKAAVLTDVKDMVAINLKHAGKGVQHKLKPEPQKGEPAGKSSRYSLKNHDLVHALDHADSKPMLKVTIKGKSYTGKIEPHSDHKHEAKK